jgi:hypothetical protein
VSRAVSPLRRKSYGGIYASGNTIFINGYHSKYECWQAGDGKGYTGDEWLIVAVPNNNIAIWSPDISYLEDYVMGNKRIKGSHHSPVTFQSLKLDKVILLYFFP